MEKRYRHTFNVITPELDIGVPVYVDDILGVGNISTVEQVIANTHKMEEEKKFKFSKKKSKYLVLVLVYTQEG